MDKKFSDECKILRGKTIGMDIKADLDSQNELLITVVREDGVKIMLDEEGFKKAIQVWKESGSDVTNVEEFLSKWESRHLLKP